MFSISDYQFRILKLCKAALLALTFSQRHRTSCWQQPTSVSGGIVLDCSASNWLQSLSWLFLALYRIHCCLCAVTLMPMAAIIPNGILVPSIFFSWGTTCFPRSDHANL